MMRSSSTPPPVPSSISPQRADEYRFERICSPAEWIEWYHPGKLHPVELDDRFKNGQYRVIRKLGSGSFSTVWLAVVESNNTYVVLKIIAAGLHGELEIHQRLNSGPQCNRLQPHVIQLLDHFEHQGTNGLHCCLVFEVLGPSLSYMIEHLPKELQRPGATIYNQAFPLWMAKQIIKQLLLSLHALHGQGVAHGDLQYGNILFAVRDLDETHECNIAQDPEELLATGKAHIVKRLDGKGDLWSPKYIIDDQPLLDFVDLSPSFSIKLSDFGAAFNVSDPPKITVTPFAFRAPEIVLGLPFDERIDLWSFGCLIFELLTGDSLFVVSSWGDPSMQRIDDDHLLQMSDTLGHLPPSMRTKWTTHSRYFDSNLQKIRTNVGDRPSMATEKIAVFPGLEQRLFAATSAQAVSEVEAHDIVELVQSILQYDPEARPTTRQLLAHRWIASIN